MNIKIIFFILTISLFSFSTKETNRYSGVYFGKKGDRWDRLDLFIDGSYKYQSSIGSLHYEESEGSWRVLSNSIELNGFYQYDSTSLESEFDSATIGLKIIIMDFDSLPFNSHILIDEEKFYTVNGEIDLPDSVAGKMQIVFNDLYNIEWTDTINIDITESKNKILIVKHVNPLTYSNYRFFNKETVSRRFNKLFFKDNSNHVTMKLKKQG
jgi:hypothetical protein